MDLMDMSVTLIVKAPNQQVEDLTIECELNWSISKLKGYLSEVYPNKPRSEDQKLIYSGKLLNDNIILKDILRKYEGQEIHTMHLVCSTPKEARYQKTSSEKSAPPPKQNNTTTINNTSASSSRDQTDSSSTMNEVRRRTVSSTTTATTTSTTTTTTTPITTTYNTSPQQINFSGYPQQDNLTTQQIAWMRAYSQYMTQYVQLINSGSQFNSFGTWPVNLMQPPTIGHPTPADTPENEQPENNNPPPIDAEEEEGRPGRRDWLDWFYIFSRVMVLTSIVYFYSSPTRFFLVSALGLMMYLYQIGFFRPPQIENLHPVTPLPNANQQNAPAEGEQQPPQQQQQQQPLQPQQEASSTAESPVVAPEQDRPSLLALTWTFFSSFFASLIPEQPGAI